MAGSWNPAELPNLHDLNHSIESIPTTRYNCIAWAAGDDQNWWWPIGAYWPPGVPRQLTIDAFIWAYMTLGYAPCADGSYEEGYEKVALYAQYVPGYGWEPTHAARQIGPGCWASKLGPCEDIDHFGVEAVEDGLYGKAVRYLRRPYPITLISPTSSTRAASGGQEAPAPQRSQPQPHAAPPLETRRLSLF
jgi:hypothetical protein